MMNQKAKGFLAALALTLLIPNFASAASYKVEKGDSLYTIGELFGTTAGQVKSDNGLLSSVIYPGQVLNIPAAAYTVQSGDSLYRIAKKYGIPLYSLRKANGKWDNAIYPGQKMIIPGGSTESLKASAVASTMAKSGVSCTAGEHDLLARLITAEANNQPYKAKISVGAVVVNRMESSDFPNTIHGVINSKDSGYYQFTPVENGMIYKAASEEAKKAAMDALNGNDPTNGALFFFDDSATNKWLWSKPLALKSGDMVFVY